MAGRGPGRWRGSTRGDRGDRGGGGNWRGDRGGSSSRSRGESPSRGERGGGQPRGERGNRGYVRGRGRGEASQALEAFSTNAVPAPEAQVKATEERVQQSLLEPPAGQLIDLTPLKLTSRPTERPGYGTKGSAVTVWANHLRMTSMDSPRLYRYHIQIDPKPVGRKHGRIIEMLLTEGRISRLAPGLASDYKMLLYTNQELTEEEDLREEIIYRFEGEDAPREHAQRYLVTLQNTGTLDLEALMNYIRSTDGRATLDQLGECLQALNIIIGHHAKSQRNTDVMSIGSNRHYSLHGQAAESFDLLGGLLAWRGYFTSVRNGASRITLNLQVKHTAVYEAIPLLALIEKFRQVHGQGSARLDRFLRRVRVSTDHLPGRRNRQGVVIRRVKTICGLASPGDGDEKPDPPKILRFGAGPDEIQFLLIRAAGTQGSSRGGSGIPRPAGPKTAEWLTIEMYFAQTYGRRVDPRYPVVNVGTPKDPVYMPADVCHVVPGQPAGAKLSSEQTRRMIQFAVRKPHLNAESIVDSGTTVVATNPQNDTLAGFGIAFSGNLITVPARILNGPNVLYRNNTVAPTRFGSWNMDKVQLTAGTQTHNWSFVVATWGEQVSLSDPDLLLPIKQFQSELERIGVKLDVPLGAPGFKLDLTKESIDSGFKLATSAPRRPKIILFVLHSNDSKTYNVIKYLGDVKYGIHTVCVLRPKLTRKKGAGYDLQYFANVALKFNLKLGGVNQSLDQSKLGIIGEGKTMVVGIDVTHPSQSSDKNATSVSGMVASINSRCSQFPAVLKIQEAREEIVSELKEMLKSRLRLWQWHNQNAFPENILVYRDGISESQFDKVIEHELPALRAACEETYPATMTRRGLPKLTVLICGKRHNTRFYPSTTQAGKIDVRSGNNPNGTVVDRGVTDPKCWDFYLQAHTALQGTARPAHYHVIQDEIFRTRTLSQQDRAEGCQNPHDVLETLTHNLSYLYGRATKAVSLCPPAYYADLLCERARCYLSDFFEPDTEEEPSSAGSSSAGGIAPSSDRVEIHEDLKDSMFYI